MNKGVYDCFDSKCCYSFKPTHRKSQYNVTEDVIGFADSRFGRMVVWECKGCGQIYFFHLRENDDLTSFDYVSFYHQYITTGDYNNN